MDGALRRAPVLRVKVRYRCGALATIEFPEAAQGAAARLAQGFEAVDCPDCAGEAEPSGVILRLDGKRVSVWRWRDRSEDADDRANGAPV